jgi:hypothetical protein
MTTNRIDPDAIAVEVDLDEDPITLPDGTVLDETAAERLGRDVADRAAARRAHRGRPSLTAAGVHSPQVSVRVNPHLRDAIEKIAERDGVRPSDVLRRALEEYVQKAV